MTAKNVLFEITRWGLYLHNYNVLNMASTSKCEYEIGSVCI